MNLLLEGCDILKACLHGTIDIPIIMHYPINSFNFLAGSAYYCLLQNILQGAKQAGQIWGDMPHDQLFDCSFKLSNIKPRAHFNKSFKMFLINCVIADDTAFEASKGHIMKNVKTKTQATFGGKL